MEVALIIALFISTGLALNSLVSGKTKWAGAFNIIDLCLIVAVAYQFDQIKNIMWVVLACALIVVAIFLIRFYIQSKKKKDPKVIDGKLIERGNDDEKN
ncbi:MAG: hypothetical protein PHH04_02350 [Thomasclavelia sp.]|jgi:Mn2+/Fe2+ NRAMP family transporter|nr:hypothetical protein [Thomasclavelia sp.]